MADDKKQSRKKPTRSKLTESKTKTKKSSPLKDSKIPPRTGARQLKPPKYSIFHIGKRLKPPKQHIKGSFRIFGNSIKILIRNWKIFLFVSLVYAVFNLLFVHGLSVVNIKDASSSLDSILGKHPAILASGFTLFVYLIGSSNSSNSPGSGIFEVLMVILVSLAIIWILREVYNNRKVKLREAFYNGMYPLVPFFVILLVIVIELIPFLIGASLYETVITYGLAVGIFEELMWLGLFLVLALISLYLITSSLFALYISTLPNMKPMKALRTARNLVRYRRWTILRKILFLPLALVVIVSIIMIPIIIVAPIVASWAFYVITILVIVVIHSYMYTLYKELLA